MLKNILDSLGLNRSAKRKARSSSGLSDHRRLRHEPLEDRRMLATLTVNVLHDNVDMSGNPLDEGDLTLRDAIAYVNQAFSPGSFDDAQIETFNNTEPLGINDKIIFDPSLNGGTIKLGIDSNGDPVVFPGNEDAELNIESSVTIDATMLSKGLTIDAGGGTDGVVGTGNGHGVINFTVDNEPTESFNYELAGLTITGGDAGGIGSDHLPHGGGITFRTGQLSVDEATLTLRDMIVTKNHSNAQGGGIYATLSKRGNGPGGANSGQVIIEQSVISENTSGAKGGGIFYDSPFDLEISDSSLLDNHAQGSGGGLYVDVDGNDFDSEGVFFNLTGSTVSGNTTEHEGGGVWFCAKFGGTFNATQSTISGNEALIRGGGLWISETFAGPVVIANLNHLTITGNTSADGGGLYSGDPGGNIDPFVITTLNHTILSGNHDLSGNDNNMAGGIEDVSSYNLLGPVGVSASSLNMNGGTGNIANANNDPGLLPLAFAGGLTPTHTPNPLSSPAIDTGNLLFDPNGPDGILGTDDDIFYDQRGTGYDRIVDGDNVPGARIDIGAVESNLGTSAAGAPQVINVLISGSASTHEEYDFDQVITDEHTKTTPRTGIQLQTVPVGGADTVSIQFSEGVTVTAEDLLLVGMRTGNIPRLVAGGFQYDASTHTASWRYESCDLETSDMYVISLADGPTLTTNVYGVHDSTGSALDGEWTNPASLFTTNQAVSTFPSGDNVAGGDFKFVFTLFGGDANQNGVIDEDDAIIHAINMYFYNLTTGATLADADFDGDGDVDADDEQLVLESVWGDINLQDLLLTADLANNDGVVDYTDVAFLDAISDYLTDIGENESLVGSTLFENLDDDNTIGQDDVDHFFAILDSQLGLVFAA